MVKATISEKLRAKEKINQLTLSVSWAFFLKWILIILIVILSLDVVTKPIRAHWSTDYLKKGDAYLLQKKYLTADLQYQKALFLNKKNTTATSRRELAKQAESNVMVLEDFYRQNNVTAELDEFDAINVAPVTAELATAETKSLIEKEEYQLAIYPAEKATELDKTYRDGWLYLGIANIKVAQNVEMTKDIRQTYLDNAKTALSRALIIDPNYQPTKDYLDLLGKIH